MGVFELLPFERSTGDPGGAPGSKTTPRRYLLQEGLRLAAAADTTFEEAAATCPEPSR